MGTGRPLTTDGDRETPDDRWGQGDSYWRTYDNTSMKRFKKSISIRKISVTRSCNTVIIYYQVVTMA